jgi:ATPase subunit of ABC transporter with duplicated ATPase domains
VERILALEDGRVKEYIGGYSDYVEKAGKRGQEMVNRK